jgi:hypothetical protein
MIIATLGFGNKRKVNQEQIKMVDTYYIKRIQQIHNNNQNRYLEIIGDYSTIFTRKKGQPQDFLKTKTASKYSKFLINPNSKYRLIFDLASLCFIIFDMIDVK